MISKPLTVTDLTRRWRCSRDRVLTLIERGQLRAVKLPTGTRRKYVIQPEAVVAFEEGQDLEEQERRSRNDRARESRRQSKNSNEPFDWIEWRRQKRSAAAH